MEQPSFTDTHIVPPLSTPVRLQEYGVGIFVMAPTKSALKKVIKKGFITVNEVVASTATFIRGGETIALTIPEEVTSRRPLVLPLTVLYEDDHLAVVHKPPGMLVSGNKFVTVSRALPQNLRRSPLPNATKPQPVHRLDFATTGALLVGKTSNTIRALNQLFQEQKIQKCYYAITIGEMAQAGGVNADIDGRPSRSDFSVVASVASPRFGLLNLVKLWPRTGRRHQLRKHLSGIGNPILGDKDYGIEGLVLRGKGLYLHAYSLDFTQPVSGEQVFVSDLLPKKFKKIFPDIEVGKDCFPS